MVEGADGLAGGLHPQTVCQIEGLDGIIECGGAEVGSTGGVCQGARVNGGLRSIVVDVGGKSSLLGSFATSAVETVLSLGVELVVLILDSYLSYVGLYLAY